MNGQGRRVGRSFDGRVSRQSALEQLKRLKDEGKSGLEGYKVCLYDTS
jgi:hypothetical protein